MHWAVLLLVAGAGCSSSDTEPEPEPGPPPQDSSVVQETGGGGVGGETDTGAEEKCLCNWNGTAIVQVPCRELELGLYPYCR